MEIIASLASARLAPLPGTEPTAMVAPSAAATAQFAALMQALVSEPVSAASAAGLAVDPTVPTAAGPSGIGDKVLKGMHNISGELRTAWIEATDTLRADGMELSMQEMLKLQLRLVQASLGAELVGKGVSSVTQAIDKVVHVQ